MWSGDAELRRALKRLAAIVGSASAVAEITPKLGVELGAQIAEVDRLLHLGASARGASKLIAKAVALLENSAPLVHLCSIKLDHVYRLASACDRLMTSGDMPGLAYLQALGAAVTDLESNHSGDDAADELAFAWDILAQAEAGLGEATDETHYARARQRYGPRPPAEAPVLALVRGAVC